MPAESAEIDAQYRIMVEEAGLLERDDVALIEVVGAEAGEFLQGQLTNDIEALEVGSGCYAALLDRKGKIRSDMRVLRIGEERFLILTEHSTREVVLDHLSLYNVGRDANVAPADEDRTVISLLGPMTPRLLGGSPVGAEHTSREMTIVGTPVTAVATEPGADLIVARDGSAAVCAELLSAGAERVETGAAEILRVEAGRPRVGYEITAATMPQEAGINDRAVSFTKGCYIGQETVARLHYKGKPNRHLRLLEPEAPVGAGDVVRSGDREVGVVGTAVLSPARGPLALAILRREALPGGDVVIGEGISATVGAIGE